MKRSLYTLAVLAFVAVTAVSAATLTSGRSAQAATTTAGCQLTGGAKHLVYIQFDNTHFTRDRPSVASDLEQMPHLLDFLTSNGTLFTNDHTILISHTAGGIVSSLTGLYPDRNGQTVSNSYFYFPPSGVPAFSSSFKYWTDLVDDATGTNDPLPNMVTDGQKTTPAPWVPFTRAGCDVGGVGTANIELENTGTGAFGDIAQVFGCPSAECTEATASNAAPSGTAARALAQTDFVGIAIHCAAGGGICTGNSNAKADKLPDEPGGYTGFQGLFGAKYVNPAITGGQPAVQDTSGQPITDPFGQPGFPGFDGMLAKNSLGYVAQMQKAGVPVTYAYISDAHDNHTLFRASGPGESDYQAQLAAYDQAFQSFFQDLAANGINKSNTLFVVTVDEGDHYAGGVSGDGTWSHTFCNVTAGDTCPANQIGEVNLNLNSALQSGYTPPTYVVHSDSAPTFYVNGNPAPTNGTLREFERKVAAAQAVNPYKSTSPQPIMEAIVDAVGEKALHMVNTDPRRTPNFTLFADPDYFIKTSNTRCPDAAHSVADCIDYHFAWSHGDIQDEIANTWVGFVGPGVQQGGVESSTWTDHANVRPTILNLLGLKDDYVPDGRVLIEALETKATPQTLIAHRETVRRLGDVYEQLNAPFGDFSKSILEASTKAVSSGSPSDDTHYTSVTGSISSLTSQRDTLATQIKNGLNAAAFDGTALNEQQAKSWIDQAQSLIDQAASLAASS
jgi:hypothetical protein